MKSRLWLALGMTFLLAACSSGDGAPKDDLSIPENLNFKIPASKKLSAAEKESFFQAFSSEAPPSLTGFLLIPEDESFKDRQDRERRLQEAGPELQALVERAQKDCKITPPVKTESKTGEGESLITFETTKASVSGTDCPILATEDSSQKIWIAQLSSKNSYPLEGVVRAERKEVQKSRVQDQNLWPFLLQTSSQLTLTTNAVFHVEKERIKGKYNSNFEAKIHHIGVGDISIRGTIEMLSQGPGFELLKIKEIVGHLHIHFQGKTYLVSVHASQLENEPQKIKTYLNGEETDLEKISKDFIPALQGSKSAP